MIVDTSAIVAVVADEPRADEILRALSAGANRISTVSWLETQLVLSGARFGIGKLQLDQLFNRCELSLVAFDAEHMSAAFDAALRFGRGRHPAAINFGDCAAYATAMIAGEPLLYVGDDFSQTDLESVLP